VAHWEFSLNFSYAIAKIAIVESNPVKISVQNFNIPTCCGALPQHLCIISVAAFYIILVVRFSCRWTWCCVTLRQTDSPVLFMKGETSCAHIILYILRCSVQVRWLLHLPHKNRHGTSLAEKPCFFWFNRIATLSFNTEGLGCLGTSCIVP
jgi:hypothetical protein